MLTPLGWVVVFPIGLIALWIQLALRIKRCHDLDRPWQWALRVYAPTTARLGTWSDEGSGALNQYGERRLIFSLREK